VRVAGAYFKGFLTECLFLNSRSMLGRVFISYLYGTVLSK
jgi:hypothetical protein